MNFFSLFTGGISGYVKIAVFALFVCGVFFAGWHSRDRDFTIYKDQVRIAAEKQQSETEAKIKEQEIINENIKQTYEARLTNIHSFYSGMLDSRSSIVSSSDPKATITINGETHNVLLVAEQCAQTTEQLITLQDWVNQQVNLK
jgi:hypothetical protein